MTSTKQIIQEFVQNNVGMFKIGTTHNPVQLHKEFNAYIKQYPLDSKVKYCHMFHSRTKTPLRNYLVNDLGLEYVTRKKGYLIRYDVKACANLNAKLYASK